MLGRVPRTLPKALDFVIEDDADEMLKIVQEVLPELADEFLLSQSEFDELIEHVSKACNVDLLREMYAQDSRSCLSVSASNRFAKP